MELTIEKAMYFWHRHLEGADPESRIVPKWNGAYKDNPTTLEEVNVFLLGMKSCKEKNMKDRESMDFLISGEKVIPDLRVVKKPKRSV